MKGTIRSFWWAIIVLGLLLCWVPCGFAGTIGLAVDSSVYNNQVLDGVYTSPYPLDVTTQGTAPSNYSVGTQLTLLCDDFRDESSVGVPVMFNTTTFGSASNGVIAGTLWGTLTLYQEGAWLSTQLVNNPGVYSYAIWGVFDPTSVLAWLKTHGPGGGLDTATCMAVFGNACTSITASAGSLLYQAQHQSFTPNEFSNWVVYTPQGCSQSSSSCASQEFFQPLQVPEGGSALLYLLLSGVSCLGAMIYSRRQTARAGMA
jgi:hypothetical protein